jgi:2-polyprenyl-3-methyl-5-hydroxy-6-metoxy-1,4-benzoquinol methylase
MTDIASASAGFGAVDQHPDAPALVAALETQAAFPAIQRLRSTAIDLFAIANGHRMLDAGCGIGDMTRRLATGVGGGKVVGIDMSETMLTEARHRAALYALPIEFRHGDVTRLEFGTASFDGAYCERVFQHLDDPEAALAELARVTRPGGRVVVIDTDWGMHAIHGADPSITRRVVACWEERTTNGWSGRRLRPLFTMAQMADVVVATDTIVVTDARPHETEPFTTMAGVAEHERAVTTAEADRWLRQLGDASARGLFFWGVTMFLVAGTTPSPS